MVVKLVALLSLVVATRGDALDREVYDDSPGDMELMYPDQNYGDSLEEPVSTSRPLTRSSLARKMAIYRMLQTLRNHDASPSYLSVPKWIPTGTVLVPPDTFDYSPFKGTLGNLLKRSADNKAWPWLLRWKIKKGKTGSNVICYLKLCSVRPLS